MPQTENHAVRVKYSCLISRELGVCNVSSPVCTALDDAISVAASPVCHTAETLLTVEKTGNTKRAQIITFGNVYKKKKIGIHVRFSKSSLQCDIVVGHREQSARVLDIIIRVGDSTVPSSLHRGSVAK